MGPASKRRVGSSSDRGSASGGGSNALATNPSRSGDNAREGGSSHVSGEGGGGGKSRSKSSSSRSKDRRDRERGEDRDRERSSSKRDRDRDRSREPGARSRIQIRSSDPSPPTPAPPRPRRRKALDPTLLARGMSGRSLGARTLPHVKPLARSEIERDLRHMDAYGAACIAYAQQFFVYKNRELVRSGHYGVVPVPHGENEAVVPVSPTSSGARQASRAPIPDPSAAPIPQGQFAMPVRIDPEEEKRVALLRKRIAASEAQREVLETDYLSLRAHYVTESQRLKRARHAFDGELKLLGELVRRRGEVVALRRVRLAVARDVLGCLERRKVMLGEKEEDGEGPPPNEGNDKGDTSMEGVECTAGTNGDNYKDEGATDKEDDDTERPPKDMLEFWTHIEKELREAERACMTFETPKDLLLIKPNPPAHPAAGDDSADVEKATGSGKRSDSSGDEREKTAKSSSSSRRSKSPTRDKGSSSAKGGERLSDDNEGIQPLAKKKRDRSGGGGGSSDSSGSSGRERKKSRSSKDGGSTKDSDDASSASSSKSGREGKDKKSKKMSDDLADPNAADGGDGDDDSDKNSSGSDAAVSKPRKKKEEDDDVVPWKSQAIPRTPHGVPVLVSHLSSAPDKSGAWGCGDVFGNEPTSLAFLEWNLPKTFASQSAEYEELLALREEARILTEELDKERVTNKELQRSIIAGRRRNDEMCAMMSMLRTETEAVLNRHNVILDTPEARSRASALHAKAAAAAAASAEDGDDEESGLDEDDLDEELDDDDDDMEGSALDEEGHEEEEIDDQGRRIKRKNAAPRDEADADDSAEEGEIQEEDNDGDDEEDDLEDDEDGEILEEGAEHGHGQPLKEVIVPRMGRGNDNAPRNDDEEGLSAVRRDGGKLSIKVKLSRKGRGEERVMVKESVSDVLNEEVEEEEDEEEGEIREDDWGEDEQAEKEGGR